VWDLEPVRIAAPARIVGLGRLRGRGRSAAMPRLTSDEALRAVRRETASFGIRYPHISCRRLSATRIRCDFTGWAERDLRAGNTVGHSGTAYVEKRGDSVEARVTAFH
jgi:hypothetical protein